MASLPFRSLFLLTVLLLAARLSPPACAAEEPAFDVEQMQGEWSFLTIERDGQKSPPERLKGRVVITKESLTLKTDDGDFVMKFSVDSTKKPAAIELTITESPFGSGYSTKGIVELKDKQLRLCYAEVGEAAPTEFASPAGKTARFIVLERVANP